MKNEEKNKENEIHPKYEYISYFGTTQKLVTRLTSPKYISEVKTSSKKNDFQNNYLKYKIQLETPEVFDYRNLNDFRNKKYLEKIQKEKKMEKSLEQELKEKNERMNDFKEKSKESFSKIFESNIRNFEKKVENALKKRNIIDNKLTNLFDVSRKIYEKAFETIKMDK